MSEFDSIALADLSEIKETKGRLIGVDFGEARTGLAVSDASRFLASGIGNVRVGGIDKTAAEIARIIKEKGVVAAVVGLPRNMDGSEGARADRCRDFARRLSAAAGIPVAMTDERLTTVAASRYLNATDTRGGRRKNVIDSLSAEIILQNTIDRLKNMN
ncbi:MAG: Holliday junction resolvase RuvX [Clostridia bacterium]|nr:Holliday junction resolvase RuvX [Clostridia bacterium]